MKETLLKQAVFFCNFKDRVSCVEVDKKQKMNYTLGGGRIMVLMILTVLFLCLMLIVSYRSKTDKSKIVAILFSVFGSIGIGLLLYLVYQEKVVVGSDWPRFIGISIMMIGLLLSEVLDVFQLLPDYREKTKEA